MYAEIRLPLPDEQIFRYEAMDDVLEITAQNPTTEFSNRDLQKLTGFGGPSVSKGLSLLEAMGLVIRRNSGGKSLYRIDERRLHGADEPYLEIPQQSFRAPLRTFTSRVVETVPSVAGVVSFGSVARGEADRVSDIDVFVLVDDDATLIAARRKITEIKRDLEMEPIEGDRYEFEVFVESTTTARKRGADLRPIFQQGIALYETETLREVKHDVFEGGSE